MNNELNIGIILKKYGLRRLYCTLVGECGVADINKQSIEVEKFDVSILQKGYHRWIFRLDGTYGDSGQQMLFPSRELYEKYPLDAAKAWAEWQDEHKPAVKTWDDMCSHPDTSPTDIGFVNDFEKLIEDYGQGETASAKSALALLKIRLLISEAYGGNPRFDDKLGQDKAFWFISFREEDHKLFVQKGVGCIDQIAFHTQKQAEEFIQHPSNRCLIRDYYMI